MKAKFVNILWLINLNKSSEKGFNSQNLIIILRQREIQKKSNQQN